jgi:putative addiction module component (TIGR02574 family)
MRIEALKAEALRLSAEERAQLAAELLESLDACEAGEGDVEQLWAAEAERRYQAYKSGQTRGIPWEEAMREAKRRLA